MSEFDLIRRHFITPNTLGSGPTRASHVALGPGDDCALTQVRPGDLLAVSSDILVAGRHFFEDVSPAKLGHKALAVNLSDLAAMGAEPKSFTLALALPQTDDAWLAAFSQGLMQLANVHQCALIGGDITRGPLTIAITVMGEVAPEHALRRDGAKP
ncbi:AIR synthase related protein, partial [Burkholderiaceae bacterium]|nr:AIR synthase related protein [Burkholderiaceae bacterium]